MKSARRSTATRTLNLLIIDSFHTRARFSAHPLPRPSSRPTSSLITLFFLRVLLWLFISLARASLLFFNKFHSLSFSMEFVPYTPLRTHSSLKSAHSNTFCDESRDSKNTMMKLPRKLTWKKIQNLWKISLILWAKILLLIIHLCTHWNYFNIWAPTRKEFLREILYKNIAIIAIQHSKMYFFGTLGDFSHTVQWNSLKSVWQISLYILA